MAVHHGTSAVIIDGPPAGRRLALFRISPEFDLCEVLRGDVRPTNLPNDAKTRRIAHDIERDAWIVLIESAEFDEVGYGPIPMIDVHLQRTLRLTFDRFDHSVKVLEP